LATGPKMPRIGVLSAFLSGQCNSCGGTRPALVDVRRGGDALRRDQAGVPCARCGAPLSFARSPQLVRFLADQQPPVLPDKKEEPRASVAPGATAPVAAGRAA